MRLAIKIVVNAQSAKPQAHRDVVSHVLEHYQKLTQSLQASVAPYLYLLAAEPNLLRQIADFLEERLDSPWSDRAVWYAAQVLYCKDDSTIATWIGVPGELAPVVAGKVIQCRKADPNVSATDVVARAKRDGVTIETRTAQRALELLRGEPGRKGRPKGVKEKPERRRAR